MTHPFFFISLVVIAIASMAFRKIKEFNGFGVYVGYVIGIIAIAFAIFI